MSVESLLYLIDVLHNIDCSMTIPIVLSWVCLISGIISFVGIYHQSSWKGTKEEIEQNESASFYILKKVIRISIIVCLISTSCGIFIPSKKTMYAMALTKYSKQSEIPQKVIQAMELKLDKIIDESK